MFDNTNALAFTSKTLHTLLLKATDKKYREIVG